MVGISAQMAIPLLDSQGNVEGWYLFVSLSCHTHLLPHTSLTTILMHWLHVHDLSQEDDHLSPEVQYTSFPPTTRVKIGGRFLEIDRAVPLKIR